VTGINTLRDYTLGGLDPGISVEAVQTPRNKSARKAILIPACQSAHMVCHNNSLPNLLRALNERLFNVEGADGRLVPTPQAKPGVWHRLDGASRRLAEFVRERTPHVQRLTCSEFVAQSPAHKRAFYARAAEEFRQRGWTRRDARLSPFVKFEKIKRVPSGRKADPCPRVIQPRSPVYNVALGRYTRAVESGLYSALQHLWGVEEDDHIVMKGMSVEDIAMGLRSKWDAFEQPVAVGLDASRFDQHIGVDALKWEHSVYHRIFECPELRRILKCQLENRGLSVVEGWKVSYQIEGTRSSGDMNTSLGNCLIMSSLVWLYCRERGVSANLANNGDDCLVFMDRRSLDRFITGLGAWFLEFGLNMTVEEPSFAFEHCEFCQLRPVFNGDRWVAVRMPHVAMAKDTMGLTCDTLLAFQQWAAAVGVGGLSLYGDMPVYRALYGYLLRNGVKSNLEKSALYANSGFARLCKHPRAPYDRNINDACRVSFAVAFGVSPSTQLVVEAALDSMEFGVLHHLNLETELSILPI